jgi:hypothetical protein
VGDQTIASIFIFAPFLWTRNNKGGCLRLYRPVPCGRSPRQEIGHIQILADGRAGDHAAATTIR